MILRPPCETDEAMAMAVHAASLEEDTDTTFLRPKSVANYHEFLAKVASGLSNAGVEEDVPHEYYFAEVNGVVVGRTSIRLKLNEYFFTYGDNISYYVLPAHRGKGYAKKILQLSLNRLAVTGATRAMVSSDDANPASWKTIEACGGAKENIVDYHAPNGTGDTVKVRRYWIDLSNFSG